MTVHYRKLGDVCHYRTAVDGDVLKCFMIEKCPQRRQFGVWFDDGDIPNSFSLISCNRYQERDERMNLGGGSDNMATECRVVKLHFLVDLLTFWHRNFFLAHSVYKMWIIQEWNKLELWNKLYFEEKKRRVYTMFKIFGTYIYSINI